MKGPAAASGRDLRALARIVTDDRGDPPAAGLSPSLLSDLAQLVGCDFLVFGGTDNGTAPACTRTAAGRMGSSTS
jgi:hypothetical protein